MTAMESLTLEVPDPTAANAFQATDSAGATISGPSAALTIAGNTITNNAPLTFDTSSSISVSSAIGGTGGLTKTGASLVQLSATGNNYTGATTVSGGTLQLGAANVIPDASADPGAGVLASTTFRRASTP